jgi:hypothetical protein
MVGYALVTLERNQPFGWSNPLSVYRNFLQRTTFTQVLSAVQFFEEVERSYSALPNLNFLQGLSLGDLGG